MTFAEQTQDALDLAHSLADERDEVTSYVAAGRPRSKAPGEQSSARVDRQVEELRADTDLSTSLRADLDDIAAVRRSALTGKSTALETHNAYSAAITELHRLAEELAERMPSRAGSGAYSSPSWTPPYSRPPPPADCCSRRSACRRRPRATTTRSPA